MRRSMVVWLLLLAGGLAARRSLVRVQGPSMEPTLWAGDLLITVPAIPRWLRPGQIVVLTDPTDSTHLVIKRILQLADDRIEVRGDDPARSTDGRIWGPVPISSVRRIAVTRWPAVLSWLTRRPRNG